MKFFLFCSLVGSMWLASAGCKKSYKDTPLLYGRWKLVMYTDGLSGAVIYPPPDTAFDIALESDHSYKRDVNGLHSVLGSYAVSNVSRGYSETTGIISFSPSPATLLIPYTDHLILQGSDSYQVFRVSQDTLTLIWDQGVAGGGTWQYVPTP